MIALGASRPAFTHEDKHMTQAELALSDDKMRAEIAKIFAETAKLNAESGERLKAEIAKMNAEARQVTVNTFLAPFLAAAGLMGATAAVVKLFF